ncbi:hypothetical protein D3C71_1556990 [compost metagenome]
MERTGTDGVQVNFFRSTGFHHRVGVFGRQNGCEVHTQISHKRGFRTVQHETDCGIVHLLDFGDQFRHVHAFKVLIAAAGDFVIGIIRVQLAFEGEHHVVGVEVTGRFEIFAALPLHAFTQVEGVDFAVFANVPFFSQARLQFGGADFEFDQTVVNWHRAGVISGTRGKQLRVEPFRGTFRTVNQSLGLHAGRNGQRNQPNTEFQNPCFSQGTCHR